MRNMPICISRGDFDSCVLQTLSGE